jgi:Phage portal protein, SPP1 Gp6-like.
MLTRLEQDIYNDAMALNPRDIASGNVTATAIQAAYQRLDNRADELEYCVIEFVQGLLRLVGVEDTPKFKRNRLTNQTEETAMILSAATVLDQQTVLEHLPFLTPDEVQVIMDRMAEQQMAMMEMQQAQIEAEAAATEEAENAEA